MMKKNKHREHLKLQINVQTLLEEDKIKEKILQIQSNVSQKIVFKL